MILCKGCWMNKISSILNSRYKIFFLIYIFLLLLFLLTLIFLSFFGRLERTGYLSDFTLEKYKENNYVYHFKTYYKSSIFKASDIYRLSTKTNNLPKYIKSIEWDGDGSSFGTLVSYEELNEDAKIENVIYSLKIKPVIYLYLFLFIICYFIICFKNVFYFIKNHILISYLIFVLLFYLIIIMVSIVLSDREYISKLGNFELIYESKDGYIYKSRLLDYKFNNSILLNISKKPIRVDKQDFIVSDGYLASFSGIPHWYNLSYATNWQSDNESFIASNSVSYNGYGCPIFLTEGEEYKITITAKRLSGSGGGILWYFIDDYTGYDFIKGTDNIPKEYTTFTDTKKINVINDREKTPYLNLIFPYGSIAVKNIRLEQLGEAWRMKDDGSFIFTSSRVLNEDDRFIAVYKVSINKNIILYSSLFFLFVSLILIIFVYRAGIISFILYLSNSSNKIAAIILVLAFFIFAFVSELKVFNSETGKETYNVLTNPNYFVQISVFLMPYLMENQYRFNTVYRTDMEVSRRKIKDKYRIYFDQYSDNHITGSIYQALKTGKNLKELRSYNFASIIGDGITNINQPFATSEQFDTPTLYTSVPNLTSRIIYNLFPDHLKYIDSLDKEIEAGYFYNKIRKCFILLHIILWSLLIYVISIRFNLLYSIVVALSFLFFPGFSVEMINVYGTIMLIPLFPAYIFAFYSSILSKKNKISKLVFWFGFAILSFIQVNLIHWASIYLQLPAMLFSFCLCNFRYQIKNNPLNNIKNVFYIIFLHIKKYVMEYILITAFIFILAYGVLYMNYRDMIYLQPDKEKIIYNEIWKRLDSGTTKLSLILVDDLSNPWQKKYYASYSLSTRIKHNILTIKYYLSYPVVYPLWRLEYFFPNYIVKAIYFLKLNYLSFGSILFFAFVLNVYICFRYKKRRFKLFIPFLFSVGLIIWSLLLFNINPRWVTHLHHVPHTLLLYLTPPFICYVFYLIVLSVNKDLKGDINE